MDVWGQLFSRDGKKQGTEFHVNTYSDYTQWSPSVCSMTNGGFIVCWGNWDMDSGKNGIYAQMFDLNGEKEGSEFQVNTSTGNIFQYPSICGLSDGGFVVCWGYGRNGARYSIYGQVFDPNGERKGSDFKVNVSTNYAHWFSSVHSLLNGGFVACWGSSGQDGSQYGVYGQLFNQVGEKQGKEFQINTCTDDSQEYPSVCGLSDSGFVVCWESYIQDGSEYGIYGKYYTYPIRHILNPFSLLLVEYKKSVDANNPVFTWQQATKARINLPLEIEYYLYLDTNENFTDPRIIKAIYDTTCTVDSLVRNTTYFWKVLARNLVGDSLWSTETNGFLLSRDSVTSVEEITSEKPKSLELLSNYPNPFNPETTIKYTLPAGQASYHVVIKIVDALGRVVQVLKDTKQSPGLYSIQWNAQDNPSGVYFCVIQAGEFKAVEKMLLMR